MKDGILWNTPKHRKSIEVRNNQRFGVQKWGNSKFHKVNHRIRVDHKTGEYFEIGKLAPKTYEKIMKETSEIKSKISDTFGAFSARDKETTILYEGKNIMAVITQNWGFLSPFLIIPTFDSFFFDPRRISRKRR